MCTYINFFRTSLRSADSKCQISHQWSKNGSECTSLCARKVIQDVNFQKSFFSSCIQDGLWLCTYVSVFFCGIRWRHNSAKFRTAFFSQFCTSLRKDSIANYASIWTLFKTSVTGPDFLCNALNISQIRL